VIKEEYKKPNSDLRRKM
jgi:hypothetical protein